jgi:hypothetical protein
MSQWTDIQTKYENLHSKIVNLLPQIDEIFQSEEFNENDDKTQEIQMILQHLNHIFHSIKGINDTDCSTQVSDDENYTMSLRKSKKGKHSRRNKDKRK